MPRHLAPTLVPSPFTASWVRATCRAIIEIAPLVGRHPGAIQALQNILATVETADWSGAEDEVFDARDALRQLIEERD